MPKDKLKQYVLLHQDIIEEKKRLEERLSEINDVLKGLQPWEPSAAFTRAKKSMGGEIPVPFTKGRGKRGRRSGGKLTTNEAILRALEGGQLDVPTIVSKVSGLKGKASRPTVYQGLMKLKKDGKVTSPARGQYTLGK